MSDNFSSNSGKPYSDVAWLDNHHSIKSKLRSELVRNLQFEIGNRVLDIGCGTGNWTFLISNEVGHQGEVIGIDLDIQALEFAKARNELHFHREQVQFIESDLEKFKPERQFDTITIFNALCYMPCPDKVLEKVFCLLKPGGRLVIKDSDLGSDFFWPVDRDLYHNLMLSISTFHDTDDRSYFDPFFARKIPYLLNKSRFSEISLSSQSFNFGHPVDQKQRQYISTNAEIIAEYATIARSLNEVERWRCLFDSSRSECIFDDPGFLYSMTEFIFQARVPSNS